MGDRVSKLEAKARRIQQELAKAREAEARKERAADTKRKVLLGALLLDWIDKDETMKAATMARLEKFLTRNVDRRIFGLTLRAEEPAVSATKDGGKVHAAGA